MGRKVLIIIVEPNEEIAKRKAGTLTDSRYVRWPFHFSLELGQFSELKSVLPINTVGKQALTRTILWKLGSMVLLLKCNVFYEQKWDGSESWSFRLDPLTLTFVSHFSFTQLSTHLLWEKWGHTEGCWRK